jgi:CBS domain protein
MTAEAKPEQKPAPQITFDQRLKQFEEQLKNGENVPPVTVRELLRWRGWERRGSFVNSWIKQSLREANLTTAPDFTIPYIDALVEFRLVEKIPATAGARTASPSEISPGITPIGETEILAPPTADPTYRIGRLRSANLIPTSVTPNMNVTEAITIMLTNDFSQLPVMIGERDVKGVISWNTNGSRLVLGVKFAEVRECMESAHVIPSDTSLLNAITAIVNNQYVLIQDETNKISGIVTTSDLSQEFRQLTEPFVLLGEIENHVRNLIQRGDFSPKQLSDCRDPNDSSRQIDSVFDMNFGEYLRLLEKKDLWPKLKLAIDRSVFVKKLDEIREIRNNVMHFDPDGITDSELNTLRKFVGFLQKLQPILRQ